MVKMYWCLAGITDLPFHSVTSSCHHRSSSVALGERVMGHVLVPLRSPFEGLGVKLQQRPDVQRSFRNCSSQDVDLADEGCEPPNGELTFLRLKKSHLNLTTKISNLVLRHSELHLDRVDLKAKKLHGLPRHSLELVRVDPETQAV